MRISALKKWSALLVLSAGGTVGAEELIIEQYFDGDGTPYILTQHLESPAAVLLEGPSHNFLRLTHSTSFQVSMMAFRSVVPAGWQSMHADFHFRISPSVRADGFSLVLLNTQAFDLTDQVPLFYSEEPNLTSSLGIGFDIHYNNRVEEDGRMSDHPTHFTDPDNNHISLHYDGQVLAQIPVDPALFDIANRQFNHYHITLTPVPTGAELTVRIIADKAPNSIDFTPVDRYFIAGFQPYQCRVLFAARVGSASTFHDLDNVHIRFSAP